MLCTVCGNRFAPFPKQDFKRIKKRDLLYGAMTRFVPKNTDAEKTRRKIFDSDQREVCPACKNEHN